MDLKCKEEKDKATMTYFKEQLKKGSIKKCYFCGNAVLRTDGCPNMSCVCGNKFCYTCGAKKPGDCHKDCKDSSEGHESRSNGVYKGSLFKKMNEEEENEFIY